ncbi:MULTISPECIES: AraC family transcriptional regulator [Priestia]|uniref:AraC family transcriptional regulator n=1 Tax=Priestia TaxID=2800373 RepID=UPI000BF9E7B6|nr:MULTISPECIES: AraC family transcriptional regulator [Priestia]MBX9996767.1 helix-turn-helix transcriptional regulator [Priestia aryabhattai]MCP1447488.1 AraC-like DNA-binding protein/mannose-6-phosphate isomerase-like protein (cupin superfamily) [Priestia megaterium]PFQ78894.1 AraC family transcriptional regulator [Priestia megaterium]WJD79157.1 AraC family transcriptional regulator [Priestia megaterium]
MPAAHFKIDENLKELTTHRTVELPVACYQTTISDHINGYIPLHWHDELQFVLVIKGDASFQINEKTVTVKQGYGLFINSGCLHMTEDTNKSGGVYICLNVSPHFLVPQELFTNYVYPYIHATNLSHLFISPKQAWGNNVLESIHKIYTWIHKQPHHYEIEIASELSILWKNLILNGLQLKYNEKEMIKNQRMKQMLNWIHLHFAEKITLDDIAKAGQLSRSECCRYFKKMLKKSPLTYVLNYRIQQSLVMLQQAEANVTDVAYQVGFNSTSYFINQFRKEMKMTPLMYRKKKLHMSSHH